MKSESLIEVLNAATEALRTMTPLLKMPNAEKGKEFRELAPVLAALRREVRRVCGGYWSPDAYRAMFPWPAQKAKPDLRSPELRELEKEMNAVQAEYDQAEQLYAACLAEEIKNPSRASYLVSSGNVVTTEIRDPSEAQRKLETARQAAKDAGELLTAARGRYYARAKAEENLRREKEYQASIEARAAQAAEQKAARKKSFAADALKFFGLRA